MNRKLSGKVAIVTGGSKGIGASIALHMADAGASVVVNYARGEDSAGRVVSEIAERGGRAVAIRADLATEEGVRSLFAETEASFGALDILVNNAGIYEFLPLEDVSVDHFRRQFDLNVLGLLLACREAAGRFGPAGGRIINIGSLASTAAPAGTSVYSASKGAVDSVTRALAKELGPRGIRVNSINPGMVDTEGARAAGIPDSDFRKVVEAKTPLGRIGVPADIGPAAVFLASSDADWITGEILSISGGDR